ncbi:MAG TPA: urate oxidase [Jiangellaceae bacterium]|nr:urate oxidase [Jiangellaceae bacterium]
MGIVLGPNSYGKAENRLVRIYRDTPRHEIRDLSVSTSLRGDFDAAHTSGDQANVLPTDTQKNTVYAFAREYGVGQIEEFALTLGRHFVDEIEPVDGARVDVDEYAWDRIEVDGGGHDHSFVRRGQEVRTTTVTVERDGRASVVSGLKDLTLLKSTGSEFRGFLADRYTTLEETGDRIMATSLVAGWRYVTSEADWAASYAGVRSILLARFATTHSLALQQTLWEMGRGVLDQHPEVAEVRLSAPNKHHFVVDLSPFGLENPNEVFYAADRPYGLIQASVLRDDAPAAEAAWDG